MSPYISSHNQYSIFMHVYLSRFAEICCKNCSPNDANGDDVRMPVCVCACVCVLFKHLRNVWQTQNWNTCQIFTLSNTYILLRYQFEAIDLDNTLSFTVPMNFCQSSFSRSHSWQARKKIQRGSNVNVTCAFYHNRFIILLCVVAPILSNEIKKSGNKYAHTSTRTCACANPQQFVD